MKVEFKNQSHMVLTPDSWDAVEKHLEFCGRICYASNDKIGEGTAAPFLENIIARGHESVLEHASMSVLFVTDRAVTHELVRHRLASYSQESQRYVNYKDGITFIIPETSSDRELYLWEYSVKHSYSDYLSLLELDGVRPQEARAVLPNSTATRIVVTANIREWRHIFRMRCDKAAHPMIRKLMTDLKVELSRKTILFDNL